MAGAGENRIKKKRGDISTGFSAFSIQLDKLLFVSQVELITMT